MGYPRIAARFVTDSAATADKVVASMRGALNGRTIRKEHALHRTQDIDSRANAHLDIGLVAAQDLEAVKAQLIARASQPDVLEAVIEWHDCGEDEPEPVHLKPWDMEYQEWRVSRDCSRRAYGRYVKPNIAANGQTRGQRNA